MLLGTPVTARAARWTMARRAVAGRLVNGYCRADWILGLVFRASSGWVQGRVGGGGGGGGGGAGRAGFEARSTPPPRTSPRPAPLPRPPFPLPSFVRPAAGLTPVAVPGVENVNLGALVKGHLDYTAALPAVLDMVGLAE